MREIRRSLYAWMSGILRTRGWTAAEWARRAGVTPTNITRFLKDPETASLPGAETLGRLARAAGSEPRFLADGHAPEVWRVPLLRPDELKLLLSLNRTAAESFLKGRLRYGARCLPLDRPPSPHAFAIRIGSDHLNAGGVVADDVVVVEPPDVEPPRTGDLVVVVHDGAVCGYRFYPPHLVPVSTDPGCAPVPCDGAAIVGTGVQLIRSLRP